MSLRRSNRGSPWRPSCARSFWERTWSDYCEAVARFALGLQRLGLRGGDRVAIMGDPCEEWGICDMAVQAAGAIAWGIPPAAHGADLEQLLRDAGASVFIAEGQEQLDRFLPAADRLDALRATVVIDASELPQEEPEYEEGDYAEDGEYGEAGEFAEEPSAEAVEDTQEDEGA